jgi:small GTP-binding protein
MPPARLCVVLVGAAGCGKTALARAMLGKLFLADECESTIGMCAAPVPGMHTPFVEVWDTAGQERYAPLVELYWRNADIVIVAFDAADRRLTNMYLERLAEHKRFSRPNLTIALWQTKSDLPESAFDAKFVQASVAERSAFTSAKTGAPHIRDELRELVAYHMDKLTWAPRRVNDDDDMLLLPGSLFREESRRCCF